MGITLIQKSDLNRPKKNPKVALVLCGGAISGGAFKLGGLIALNSFLANRKTTEMDMYLGISAGAFLSGPLSAGIGPEELFLSIRGESERIDQFRPTDFYYPNYRELVGKGLRAVRDAVNFVPRTAITTSQFVQRNRRKLKSLAKDLVNHPNQTNLERLLEPLILQVLHTYELPHIFSYLPSGLFDNSRIEKFMRRNLERNGLPNTFRLMKLERNNELYICATNLDTAEGVVFGHDEDTSVTISQAVQASTALPGFFKPARLNGVDYIDAGIRKTANISTVVRKKADLIICYNPFRPFVDNLAEKMQGELTNISDMGFISVLNQTFRTLLHTRLRVGLEKLKLDPSFQGDVIVIEPQETDLTYFNINPVAFWNRTEAALLGFKSVRSSLERHYPKLVRLFRAYGIETDLDGLRENAMSLGLDSYDDTATELHSYANPSLRVVK